VALHDGWGGEGRGRPGPRRRGQPVRPAQGGRLERRLHAPGHHRPGW